MPLFAALARVAEWRGGEFSVQNVANMAWAVATSGQSDASLCAALAMVMERRIGELNA